MSNKEAINTQEPEVSVVSSDNQKEVLSEGVMMDRTKHSIERVIKVLDQKINHRKIELRSLILKRNKYQRIIKWVEEKKWQSVFYAVGKLAADQDNDFIPIFVKRR